MKPPLSETELLQRCQQLAGASLGQIAAQQQLAVPENLQRHKGWVGQLMELALGASAGNKAEPDFQEIGVELKTLPLNKNHHPKESTFVCTVSQQLATHWHDSVVWHKLKRVLWLPIEAEQSIPLAQRRVGQAFLWSPNAEQEATLKQDWQELTELLSLGHYAELTAKHGTYLQCRPKAANNKILREAINQDGDAELIIPRGFYLRPSFTQQIIRQN